MNQAFSLIQYFFAIIIAVILAALLLPFILIFCFLALLVVLIYSVRRRYFRHNTPPVKPKGTVEILMPNDPPQPNEPPLKATTDADLEVTIETLQKTSKKHEKDHS